MKHEFFCVQRSHLRRAATYVASVCATFALLLTCSGAAQAAWQAGPWIYEEYGPSGGFNAAWAWVDNPNFVSHSNAGLGSMWGLWITNNAGDGADLRFGYSIGQFAASTSTWKGTFVDNQYYSGGTAYETFYDVDSPGPSGNVEMNEDQSSTDYHSVDINGTTVVTNLYRGAVNENTMLVTLENTKVSGGGWPLYFPTFTSGSGFSGIQTYYSGGWHNWPATGPTYSADLPTDEQSAYGTYSNDGTSNYFYIYSS